MKRAVVLGALFAATLLGGPGACRSQDGVSRRVVVSAPAGSHVDLERLAWQPRAAARRVRAGEQRVEIELSGAGAPIVLEAPGACAATLPAASVPAAGVRTVELRPLLVVEARDAAQIGYDAPFAVSVKPGCDEARAGKIAWRQTSGAPVAISSEEDGFLLRGRTRAFSAAHPEPLPWGIVPISPRTRDEVALELAWQGGGREQRLTTRLASAARATGVPSVALGQRVLLGGAGWKVHERPRGGTADVTRVDGIAALEPDARGRWVLRDADQRELSLVAGLHDETPLDCGRAGCHAREAEAVVDSPMTKGWHDALLGRRPALEPGCALACHTIGEPGLGDGGFADVLARLGLDARFEIGPDGWDALPRPLRRLGGVGCTACHGPGAVPEPAASWAILRSDVCAHCHDAPPRYGHVSAWRQSRMASADRDPEARSASGCRGCHTTAGFLARIGAGRERRPPEGVEIEIGIACAACHAPHAAHVERALVRDVPLPAGFPAVADAASRLCVACHAGPPGGTPAASAATLVHGSAGGEPPPHADVPGGCMGCHGTGGAAPAGARGGGHSFQVDRASCTARCHRAGPPIEQGTPGVRERALALLRKLAPRQAAQPTRPWHARGTPRPALPAGLVTVLEDPAAGVHNAPFARALLDAAERR